MKKRLTENCIIRNVHSLLPDGGNPKMKEEDITPSLILRFFLNNHCKLPDKNHFYNINPKYMYSYGFFDRIKKLRNIFLEFDADCSSK